MSEAPEDVVNKIRKLMAMARDKGATEGEMANALRLAQNLMLKYGITHIDEEHGKVAYGPKIVDLDKRHHEVLAMAVGRLYGAKPVFQGNSGTFCYVGRPEIREAATMTVNFIADQVDALYKTAFPKGMTKAERGAWRREFKLACAMRVSARISDMVMKLKSDDQAAAEAIADPDAKQLAAPVKGTALTVLAHFDQLEAEVEEFFVAAGVTKGRALKLNPKATTASMRGFASGDKVNINHAITKKG